MATGDDIQMPWGSWGIGVSRERRKDGIWFKVRLCLYRRSHFLGRFEDPFIARLAYDAAISQLRPGSRTNYDRRFFELTDAAALDKVQVFVLKTEQQYGKSKYAKHAGQGLPGSPMEEEVDTSEEEEPADPAGDAALMQPAAGQLLHRSSSGLTALTSMLNSAQQQLQQDPEQLMTAASFMQMLDSMPVAQQQQLSPPPQQQQQQQLDALLPAFLGPAATRHTSPGSPGQSVMAAAAAGMYESTSSIPYPYTHPEPLAAFQRGNGANNAGAAGSYGYYEPMPLTDPGWAAAHSMDAAAAAAAAPMYAAAECGYAPNVHMAFDGSNSSSPSNSSSSNGSRGLLTAAGRPVMAAGRPNEAARYLQGIGHTASPFAVAPHQLAALQQQHARARPAVIEPYPPAVVGMPPAAGTSAHSTEAFNTTQQQQQQQQQLGVCMASPMTDAEWDLILQQLLPSMYIQEQQQQQQHLMQQQQLFSSAHMLADTPPLAAPYPAAAAAAAAPMHAAAAVAGRGSRGSPRIAGATPQLMGPSSAATAAAAAPMLAAAAAGSRVMPSIAGTSTPSDVLCFIRVSVAQLLQLNASLMMHSGNSCAFGEVCAWMSQARLALEADPGTDSSAQQQGSKGAVELLRQLMMVFSQSISAGGSGSGTYGAGVLAARPAVKALVDSLLAALASLGQLLAACGAAPCSSISEEMVAGWLAGLQQLAARGSAADVSVLQLCSTLSAEPYAGL
uniref:AP2/ERF domain-containing protein n=1 Tax=Tetradesmus obliquus TaxID=3088 RepID=A0A383VBG1_TETOB|eukprot:jgi/Sobl393_1/13185/SZX62092.1